MPRPYVLLVDDFADGREMLSEYLAFRGFEVVEVTDGEKAVECALERPPAIVLMDLQMPVMDGWEATRRLRAHPVTKDIIILAVTAHAIEPNSALARQAGCDGFIPKPFALSAVADLVGELLKRGRAGLSAVPSSPQG